MLHRFYFFLNLEQFYLFPGNQLSFTDFSYTSLIHAIPIYYSHKQYRIIRLYFSIYLAFSVLLVCLFDSVQLNIFFALFLPLNISNFIKKTNNIICGFDDDAFCSRVWLLNFFQKQFFKKIEC